MGRIGFWQLLLDDRMSWWEAQRINDAQDMADIAANDAQAAHFRASTLESRINAMSREIVMLRTALTVLTNTLKDSKVLDERLLDARLEAAMEEAQAAQQKVQAARVPSLNDVTTASASTQPPPMITCIRCRKAVAASTTLMTADGPMCERAC
jgi:hypothetical protein